MDAARTDGRGRDPSDPHTDDVVDIPWEQRRADVAVPPGFAERVLLETRDRPDAATSPGDRTGDRTGDLAVGRAGKPTGDPEAGAQRDPTTAPTGNTRRPLTRLLESSLGRAALALLGVAVCAARIAHLGRLFVP